MDTNIQKNKLYVGRGTTAIYLVLATKLKGKEVILPGNICYAAIFGVLYSGNIPRFCDILDDFSGNTNLDKIRKVVNGNTGAIIFPYMYGNISNEIFAIREYCDKHNIILIEDCASAFGGQFSELDTQSPCANIDVGSVGHYSFFSFGHAKNVDLGNGGLLYSNNDMSDIENLYSKLSLFAEPSNRNVEKFSFKYRKFLINKDRESIKNLFDSWISLRDCFLYRLQEPFFSNINTAFTQIQEIKTNRLGKYKLYKSLLNNCNILQHSNLSLPWRFCIYVEDSKMRRAIINRLLNENLFVSDWYPNNSLYFSDDVCTNCEIQGNQILNFSLVVDDGEIRQICEIINDTL